MAQEVSQAELYPFSGKQIAWGLVAIFASYGSVAYFVQTMSIARPKIAADLDGLSIYGWSVAIPALVMALVTIIFGKFSDMYGRRTMLMISLIATLIGTVLSALSPNYVFLIVVSILGAVGAGAIMPLVFVVVGDLFPPHKRSKWIGLLNIPLGVFTLTGPALSGFVVDTWHWRYLYWISVPLLIFCLVTVPVGVPSLVSRDSKAEIDVKGCIWVALASSTSILGFSYAGTTYPWVSTQIIGLLGFSLACWVIFLRVEFRAKEPILDPGLLRNRTFSTVALATFFSSFGTMGMMMYFPMLLQGVQDISTLHSGYAITPYGVLTAFMGVPAGYVIARSGRFKWMYIAGYGILAMSMFALISFTADTSIVLSVVIALLAGLGYGVIPTINTIVIQNAVPKRLIGAAMGAIFFFLNIGGAIAPAILGSTMNVTYAAVLSQSLPDGVRDVVDEKTMETLDDPQVLLSGAAMEDLRKKFRKQGGNNGPQLFQQTIAATRHSLEAGIRSIFWVSAITALLSFLIILTVPRKYNDEEENF